MSPDESELASDFIEKAEVTDYDWSVTLTTQDSHSIMGICLTNGFRKSSKRMEQRTGSESPSPGTVVLSPCTCSLAEGRTHPDISGSVSGRN